MGSDATTAAPGWAQLRRPSGLVAQTRWLFTLLAVASVLLAVPGLAVVNEPGPRWAAAAAFGGLVAIWVHRYRAVRAPLLLDLGEALLVVVGAACGPDPTAVFAYLFSALWLRALYGSTRAVLGHTALMALAVLGGSAAWGLLPLRAEPLPPSSVSGVVTTLPVMFLTAAVARYLVLSLFTREQSQERGAALVRLGNALIGVTDPVEVLRRGSECARAVCAATPGLRLLAVREVDDRAVVVDHAGPLREVPATLPASVLPADRGGGVRPVPDAAPLDRLAGSRCGWVGVPLADQRGGWILAGAPPRVPVEVLVALRSMSSQVALALRTSAAHRDLAVQAREDPLTGLANRAAFTAALEAGVADPARRVALLFLDLDDFKSVNDGLGHSAGDELLRQVAARLRAGVRPDELCARIGGDEFAVLLDGADRGPPDAVATAQRLVELVRAPVPVGGRMARVGASAGLAPTEPGDCAEQLLHRADVAMYAAKAGGGNRVQVFHPGLLDDAAARFEAEVAAAAAADQLVVHYQPIVLVRDGSCVAVEALVRWRHPVRGLLAPAHFVATAERTGAIVDIGARVLRRACAEAAGWSGPRGPLAVHVNVSAVQLATEDFVETVRGCLAAADLPPHRLVLEITESMALDTTAVHSRLAELAATGVQLALDDFGTGYSALSVLRSLPLDVVKIDKSFAATGPAQVANRAVIEAVVQVAARLDLLVVAEGVERAEQQRFLREAGVDAVQGHLHLRPAPADDLARWLDGQDRSCAGA